MGAHVPPTVCTTNPSQNGNTVVTIGKVNFEELNLSIMKNVTEIFICLLPLRPSVAECIEQSAVGNSWR